MNGRDLVDTFQTYFTVMGRDWKVWGESDTPGNEFLVIEDSHGVEWKVALDDSEDYIPVWPSDLDADWKHGTESPIHGSMLFLDGDGNYRGVEVNAIGGCLRVDRRDPAWFEGDLEAVGLAAIAIRFAIETDGVLVKASMQQSKYGYKKCIY